MEVTVDKYGRIVIPKAVRERLGLQAGSTLELGIEPVEGGAEAIALRPAGQEPCFSVRAAYWCTPEWPIIRSIRLRRSAARARSASRS